MGKDWEARQVDKLVKKQRERIAELQQKVENDYPEKPANEVSPTKNKRNKENPGNPEFPLNS